MKRILIVASAVILLGGVLGAWLHFRFDTTVISDVTRPASLTLKKRPSQGYIHYLEMRIVGSIDGTAEILVIAERETLHRTQVNGSVALDLAGDCYTDEVEVRYSPNGVTDGRLQVEYRFRD